MASKKIYLAFNDWKTLDGWIDDPRTCVKNPATIKSRLLCGWDFEAAVTTPLLKGGRGDSLVKRGKRPRMGELGYSEFIEKSIQIARAIINKGCLAYDNEIDEKMGLPPVEYDPKQKINIDRIFEFLARSRG